MIFYIKHTEIDKHKWDACVSASKGAHLCAYSWWLDVVCPHWCALVENDYENVFPLPAFKKYGISYLIQPYFSPRFYVYGPHPEKVNLFLSQIPSIYKKIKLRVFAPKELIPPSYSATTQFSQCLDLNKPYEELRKAYTKGFRKNEKIASSFPLEIREDEEDIPSLLTMMQFFLKSKIQLPETAYEQLNQLLTLCQCHFPTKIFSIYIGEECLQRSFVTLDRDRLYIHSGFSTKGREYQSRSKLTDFIIQRYAERPLRLDFGGSNIDGIRYFNHSFGSQEEEIQMIEQKRFPLSLLPF